MANLDLLVIESEKKKRKSSQTQNLTLSALTIGATGGIVLSKDGNGNWDFNAKTLSNVADPVLAGDAVTLGFLNGLDARTFTNVQGSTITVNQIVFESSTGNVQLASGSSNLNIGTLVGLVNQASIANAASGSILLRAGKIVSGFSGLVVNTPVYIHPTSAGGLTQSLAGFTPGMRLFEVGEAVSATEILFTPTFQFEY